MKNIIHNDSLQRVEPAARILADQTQKNLADQIATARAGELERDQKRTQVEDTANPQLSGDFSGGQPPPGKKRPAGGAPKGKPGAEAPPREHFLGGQLLDTEA